MEAGIEGFSVDEKYRYVNTKSNPENIRAAVFKGVVLKIDIVITSYCNTICVAAVLVADTT